MIVGNAFLPCMAKDARLSSRILAGGSQHKRLTIHHNVSRARITYIKSKYGYLIKIKMKIIKLFLCLIQKLCVHPTSTKVSDQLTKMTKSYLQPMHLVIILYPVWAGFKCNSLDLCSIGVCKR